MAVIKKVDKILAQEFVRQNILTEAAAQQALEAAAQENTALKDYLLDRHLITEDQMIDVFSHLYKIPVFDASQIREDPELVRRVPVKFASYYKIVPVRIEGKVLEIASAQPMDVKFQDDIRVHLGLEPHIVLSKPSEILLAQNRLYGLAADVVDRLAKSRPQDDSAAQDQDAISDIEQTSDEASVTRLVNQILLDAYQKRATDIHIEPYRNKMRVRYRIDGVLMDANVPDAARQFLPSIVSRMKILSNLSIVEKRLPQDGSAVVQTREQNLDLRISTIPTPRGESMVVRILPTNVTVLGLDRLGLEASNLRLFRDLIKRPHGIVLVTGPTGSGKTTTLYACLTEINNPTQKIITLEDPVEYEMEGVTQIQVNPKIGFDFAAGLRSVLRHDPDVIMVGEIRDFETAEIAIRTALTGHLVFSTLHTNDAASSVTRLIEMGLEPFLVTSSIEAFIAQRLVRTICPKCRVEMKTSLLNVRKEISSSLGMALEDVKIFRGEGCPHCNQTGFYGRTAIYEVLVLQERLRQAVLERRNAEQIKKIAVASGMVSLRQDGWKKVVAGLTTPEEVMNVTVQDDEANTVHDTASSAANPSAASSQSGTTQAPAVSESGRSPEGGRVKEHIVLKKVLEAKNEYDSRVYPRLKYRADIRYMIYHQDRIDPRRFRSNDIQHSSVTKDVSAGGVRFISGYALPVETILEVTLVLEAGLPGIHCLAKICRVEDDAFSAMFHLVAFFLDLSSSDRARVEEFVNRKMKEDA